MWSHREAGGELATLLGCTTVWATPLSATESGQDRLQWYNIVDARCVAHLKPISGSYPATESESYMAKRGLGTYRSLECTNYQAP